MAWLERLGVRRSATSRPAGGERARAGLEFGAGLDGGEAPAPDPGAAGEARGRLIELFEANTEGPGIWKWRHYFPAYERHLAKFVGAAPTVVEIGVYSGGSLAMWREYFGFESRIVGVDIEPACRAYEAPGIEIAIGDQADPGFWAEFARAHPALDVVIDDGGHEPRQQIATLEALLPQLRDGGVYICEDVTGVGNEFQDYVDGLARNLNADEWISESPAKVRTSGFQRLVGSVHHYPFLTVVERTASPVGELEAPRHGSEWQPFFDADRERERRKPGS